MVRVFAVRLFVFAVRDCMAVAHRTLHFGLAASELGDVDRQASGRHLWNGEQRVEGLVIPIGASKGRRRNVLLGDDQPRRLAHACRGIAKGTDVYGQRACCAWPSTLPRPRDAPAGACGTDI